MRVRWRWARRSFQSTANSASSLEDDDVDWADIYISDPPHSGCRLGRDSRHVAVTAQRCWRHSLLVRRDNGLHLVAEADNHM